MVLGERRPKRRPHALDRQPPALEKPSAAWRTSSSRSRAARRGASTDRGSPARVPASGSAPLASDLLLTDLPRSRIWRAQRRRSTGMPSDSALRSGTR